MAKRLVTVFGGSGFIGRYIVERLAARGHQVRVAVRRPNEALFLKPLGDLGQVQIVAANLKNEASVRRAVAGADSVVNLVGVLFAAGGQTFKALQATGAGLVAKAAADAGVRTMVHMSALGAAHANESLYARTKAAGEDAVLAAFPSATILRPSVVIGAEDGFFNRFAGLVKLFPFLPIPGTGTRFQPVYVADVADAAVKAADVKLFKIHVAMAIGGKGFLLLCGAVSDVEAAIEAGAREIGKRGLLVSRVVIPRPEPELFGDLI